MKCVIKWIPLRIRVRWRNAPPHLKGLADIYFEYWYTANTNHFKMTYYSHLKMKTQLGWKINQYGILLGGGCVCIVYWIEDNLNKPDPYQSHPA